MTIEWTEGDLFAASDLPALAHGCNCAGSMGAGIAVEFRRRWPDMFEEYRALCESGRFQPGDVFLWEAPDRTIFNLGTQKTWRTKATLVAIESSVAKMCELADSKRIARVGLPRIGAGLGGLEWDDVREVIGRVASTAKVKLVVFEKFVPAADTPEPPRPTKSRRGSKNP
ncbi:MAG TPA: macro domain-containing protein [Planctomycetota bacterium]|nr:macro domain-containing protein [Planctomycetota bacterium]